MELAGCDQAPASANCNRIHALRIHNLKTKPMIDIIYIGTAVMFFAAFALYAVGCEKL